MKKFLAVAMATIFAAMTLTACNLRQRDDGYVSDLDYALAHANQRREAINHPTADYLEALAAGRTHRGTIDLRELMTPLPTPREISAEDAVYDTNVFFSLLRDIYGAYYCFGGDEVFLPMWDDIILQLQQQDTWNMASFRNLLADNLSAVIGDNHFWIDNRLIAASTFFFEFGHPFEKAENGFRHTESGLYVADIAGYEPDDVFRLSLNAYGELYYAIVVAQPNPHRLPMDMYELTIVLENGETLTENMVSTRPRPFAQEFPSLRYEDDIPVVTVRSMGHPESEVTDGFICSAGARLFLSFAEELADEPVVIIDIRSNTGGNALLSTMWLYRFLGEVVPHNLYPIARDVYLEVPDAWLADFYNSEESFEKYWAAPAGDTTKNDRLIVLLTDRFAWSAGDAFASQMLNVQNTLVVGQNTGGALITDSLAYPMYLPNSGLPFVYGTTRLVHPHGLFEEGLGVAPDVWVSGDALTATLAMLAHNR
ncbi:MAG: S41 family peptidase [Defluviitaleaceae bacterium]|nr:S41 family peptidase [Defluviitaleaceae bacterium]